MVVPDEGFKVPYQIFLFLEKPQEKFVGAIASVIYYCHYTPYFKYHVKNDYI